MICPKCNNEIKEGLMYCENCGYEINIVPEFDPEFEIELDLNQQDIAKEVEETLSDDDGLEHEMDREGDKTIDDILEDIDDGDLPGEEFWDDDEGILNGADISVESIVDLFKKNLSYRIIGILAVILLFAAIVVLTVSIINTNHQHSYSYLVNKGYENMDAGEYTEAINYFEKAIGINSGNLDDRMALVDCYMNINDYDNASYVLRDIIANSSTVSVDTYKKLFMIYESENNIDAIIQTLNNCNDEKIKEQFPMYRADMVEFSQPEGEYNDVLYLKLSSNTTGNIYYTINGEEPTTESTLYTSPIFLESGIYVIRAIFVNSFGVVSDVNQAKYEISVIIPPAPYINLESGQYTSPELITLDISSAYEYSTYYTTDGTMPTKDSLQYRGPIYMPLGDSTFNFVTYGNNDVPSEMVTATYSLILENATVTPEDAVNSIIVYKVSSGGMLDTDGHLAQLGGRLVYKCDSAVAVEGEKEGETKILYVVYEYYEDPTTFVQSKTGDVYVVSYVDPSSIGKIFMKDGEITITGP